MFVTMFPLMCNVYRFSIGVGLGVRFGVGVGVGTGVGVIVGVGVDVGLGVYVGLGVRVGVGVGVGAVTNKSEHPESITVLYDPLLLGSQSWKVPLTSTLDPFSMSA